MIYKTRSPLPGCVRVIFELPSCIWADHIAVVGDFNGWCAERTPMRQDHDGVWRAVVDLPQHSWLQFRYLVNREWMTDYHADGYVANPYGSDNSLLIAALETYPTVVKRQCSHVINGGGPGYHQPLHKSR